MSSTTKWADISIKDSKLQVLKVFTNMEKAMLKEITLKMTLMNGKNNYGLKLFSTIRIRFLYQAEAENSLLKKKARGLESNQQSNQPKNI